MCFDTKKQKQIRQGVGAFLFQVHTITSSDKTEVRNLGRNHWNNCCWEAWGYWKRGRRNKRLSSVPANFQGCLLPGLPAQLQSLCMKLLVKQGNYPSTGTRVGIPASTERLSAAIVLTVLRVQRVGRKQSSPLRHQFIRTHWPLSPGSWMICHLWNALSSNCADPKLSIWSSWPLFPLHCSQLSLFHNLLSCQAGKTPVNLVAEASVFPVFLFAAPPPPTPPPTRSNC